MSDDLPLSDDFQAFRQRTAWPAVSLAVASLMALATLVLWRSGWGVSLAVLYLVTVTFFVFRHRQAYEYLRRPVPAPVCPHCGSPRAQLRMTALIRDRFGVSTTYRLDCAACQTGLGHLVSAAGHLDGCAADLAVVSRRAQSLRASMATTFNT